MQAKARGTAEEVLQGQQMGPVIREWSAKDSILYALGLGFNETHLAYTTNNTGSVSHKLVPSFVAVLSQIDQLRPDTTGLDTTRAVHASQSFRLHENAVLPAGRAELTTEVTSVSDKGKGAIYTTRTEAVDPGTRQPIFTSESSVFIVGAGGYGGDRGSSQAWERPETLPDAEVSLTTWTSQPLLYRLNGDYNPLHSDPDFARQAGYRGPILHGMATYGMACRALLGTVCAGHGLVRGMDAQFTKPVFPGETLTYRIWGDSRSGVFVAVNEQEEEVLSKGRYFGGKE